MNSLRLSPTTFQGKPQNPEPKPAPPAKVRPVVIYPYLHPADCSDLEELYRLMEKLDADRDRYARPITVMDRKTFFAAQWNRQFQQFRSAVIEKSSDILDAWCVDTCQMWYTGLGHASDLGGANDTYWLIPGDFNYGTDTGREMLARLVQLPQELSLRNADFCLGEITVDLNSSKQLIDTYGTFGLLYNWFPQEAAEIRRLTERPRSEFFAIRHGFLREVLRQRWYAYEQTLVILLQGLAGRKQLTRLPLGDISDLPQGQETFASALQQVERTERVLKLLWREQNQQRADWAKQFEELETASERIRRAALIILRNLLR